MPKSRPETPDWERIETDVVLRLHLLRAAWEHTAQMPELQRPMARDLYKPALTHLAAFCASVEISEGEDESETSDNPRRERRYPEASQRALPLRLVPHVPWHGACDYPVFRLPGRRHGAVRGLCGRRDRNLRPLPGDSGHRI